MNKKALIAMSGGVDSSVAAFIMKKNGFDLIGVTMKLFGNDNINIQKEHTCCSLDDIEDAKSVANRIGIPHYTFNFTDSFEKTVIKKFVSYYENGKTPNPCIDCNRYMKFDKLYNRAKELGCNYIVTGHYAKIEFNKSLDRYLLKKSEDITKDQSYVLYSMTQEQLKHTIFPLGNMTKVNVRQIAEKEGFVNAKKHDSQDICFVLDGNYAKFIEKYTGKSYPNGVFLSSDGKILGTHKGIIHYTIGQRRGIDISFNKKMYVCSINSNNNTIVLGENEELFRQEFFINNINVILGENINYKKEFCVKVRYQQKEQPAYIKRISDDIIKIKFIQPQRAVTKGQAAVIYDGDIVVGGGTIM